MLDSEKVELENETQRVMNIFFEEKDPFTSVDISNLVKNKFPHVRHRDIAKIVRSIFESDCDYVNYTSTQITVTLSDGLSTAQTNLYHHVQDSWDLDRVYDYIKRHQTAKIPTSSFVDVDADIDDKVSTSDIKVAAQTIPTPPPTVLDADNNFAQTFNDLSDRAQTVMQVAKKKLAGLGSKIIEKLL